MMPVWLGAGGSLPEILRATPGGDVFTFAHTYGSLLVGGDAVTIHDVFTNPVIREAVLAILASATLITLINDALANAFSRIPWVGWLLAIVVRRLTPMFWTWLRNEVGSTAELAVMSAQAKMSGAPGDEKKRAAIEELKAKQPGLTFSELDREVEDAFQRLMGRESLSLKAKATK